MTLDRPILLLGATGQVGAALEPLLAERFRVLAPTREQVDLLRPWTIAAMVEQTTPAIIINAAAFTAVDTAERDASAAHAVNAEAPAAIALAASRVGAAIVHFSTDYVFDGRKREPYVEDDPPNPQNVYGRSKLAGDQAIAASGVPHLIFRTSWVYSQHGRNFLLAILNRARAGQPLRVVDDQRGAPTSSRLIASVANAVVLRLCASGDALSGFEQFAGLYNLTATGSTTWFGFARAILDRAGIDAEIEPISTEAFNAPAPRPRYSVLDTAKLTRTFDVRLPDWQTELHSVLPAKS
jgi:dTDP-4-dehydrorhamnose reductase